MDKSYPGKERSEAQSLLRRRAGSEQVAGGNKNAVDGASKFEETKASQCEEEAASNCRVLTDEAGEREVQRLNHTLGGQLHYSCWSSSQE